MLNAKQTEIVLRATQATTIAKTTQVQSLWSGYGAIYRVALVGSDHPSVVVKSVDVSQPGSQPRGWNTDRSHQRKIRSYRVEMCWYQEWASQTDNSCRVPIPLFVEGQRSSDDHCQEELTLDPAGDHFFFVLEDLDASGFFRRCQRPSIETVRVGLRWLANFHARFLHPDSSEKHPGGLWPEGTYWHLATRPDELAAMPTSHSLRKAAEKLDHRLRAAQYRTLIHGDAKVANLCFSNNLHEVAAVDFQYIGGGCGMKDFAYFVGSCLNEDECEEHVFGLLDDYFAVFRPAAERYSSLNGLTMIDPIAVESEWRELFPIAWADFNRFLLGWCPGHPKLHRFSQAMTDLALESV